MTGNKIINRLSELNKNNPAPLLIINGFKCVNSKWRSRWLAQKNQESCQCIVECKVQITYKDYGYIVTKKELLKIIKEQESI